MDPLGQVAQLLGVHRANAQRGAAPAATGERKPAGRGEASLAHISHSGSALADMASRLREVGFVHDPQGANHEDHQRHRHHEAKDGAQLKEFRETDEHKRNRKAAHKELSQEDVEKIRELKETDSKVKVHEMAHKTAAGSLAAGGPFYEYEQGPDGVSYAVAGHVPIHLPETSDPEQALRDSEKASQAALAAGDPSPADRAAAAQFSARAALARQDIAKAQSEKSEGPPHKPDEASADAPSPGAEEDLQVAKRQEARHDSAKPLAAHQHPEFLLGAGFRKPK